MTGPQGEAGRLPGDPGRPARLPRGVRRRPRTFRRTQESDQSFSALLPGGCAFCLPPLSRGQPFGTCEVAARNCATHAHVTAVMSFCNGACRRERAPSPAPRRWAHGGLPTTLFCFLGFPQRPLRLQDGACLAPPAARLALFFAS